MELVKLKTYLTLIEKINYRYGIYKCSCGNIKRVRNEYFKTGHIKSCGCKKSELLSLSNSKHGMEKSLTYCSWLHIKQRCLNPLSNQYKYYGGRGITICKEWSESFEKFYEDMGERPSKHHTIHRLDNDKNYEKSNCVWATKKTQARNRRNNRYITYNGENRSLAEWSEITKIPYSTLFNRLRMGYELKEVFNTNKRVNQYK